MKNPLTLQQHTEKDCPIEKLVRVISDAWTILILRDIFTGPKRFCELEKSLTGISTRTLTLKLQKLVEEGVLDHNEHYYSISEKGSKLRSVIAEIEKVGKKF